MENLLDLSVTVVGRLIRNSQRLMVLAWKTYPWMVIALLLLTLCIAGMPFLRSGSVALLINELVAAGGVSSRLVWLIVFMSIAAVLPDIMYAIKEYVDKRFWIVFQEKLELLYLEHKGAIDLAAYEDPEFHDLLMRAETRSIFPMLNLLEAQFSNLQNIIQVPLASAVLIAYDWRMFLLVAAGAIPKFVLETRYGHGVWSLYDSKAKNRREFHDLRRHFYGLAELTELKLFQNARYLLGLISRLLRDFSVEQKSLERRKLLSQLGAIAASGGTLVVVSVWIVFHVAKGGLEVGTMTFILGAIVALQNALSGFFLSLASQYQHNLFVTDLFSIMETKPKIPRTANPTPLEVQHPPEIVFENVSFAYPGTNALVLRKVNLTIGKGEKLALVGMNGSGKTTLVKLLCRIYDPTEGRILINGCDLRELDLERWHYLLGVLFQDYSSYHFPTKEVIAMGRRNGSSVTVMERVERAARVSGAEEFIQGWPGKFDQMIGKEFGGIDPSKGQRQRLALARLIYRGPSLMILDEPTASVDAAAEVEIFERIFSLPREATMLLISHRFSAARKADRICVVENGTLAEIGTHTELMELGGIYSRLFNLQADGYRE